MIWYNKDSTGAIYLAGRQAKTEIPKVKDEYEVYRAFTALVHWR